MTTVKVPCARDAAALDLPEHVSPINLAARVDANDALSGWLIFAFTNGLTHDRAIEYYDVVVRDVHGTEEGFRLTWLTLVDSYRVPAQIRPFAILDCGGSGAAADDRRVRSGIGAGGDGGQGFYNGGGGGFRGGRGCATRARSSTAPAVAGAAPRG